MQFVSKCIYSLYQLNTAGLRDIKGGLRLFPSNRTTKQKLFHSRLLFCPSVTHVDQFYFSSPLPQILTSILTAR